MPSTHSTSRLPATPRAVVASPSPVDRALTRRAALASGARLATATFLAAASAALATGCNGPDLAAKLTGTEDAHPATSSTFAFDTFCTFSVYGDEAAPAKLARACARYDKLFNLYDEDSDIARINAAGGRAVEVDEATAELIARALTFCERADGLFDITIGAVSTLWDFEEHVRPSDERIAAALPHVNWRCVEVDEEARTVRLTDAEARLDLGAIAKGFVADKLYELLERETKATAASISLGGNIIYFGEKPGGGTWDTGLRDPNDPGGNTVVGTTHVRGGSLVTSGLYERTFEQDGVTYWHILDPRTGMPVQTDVASDTVVCASSTQADALSTTLFVAGSKQGARIVDGYEDAAAYFLKRDGSALASSRWEELTDFEK